MISSLLDVLRGGTYLVVTLRFNVVDLFTSVESLADISEVLLHEVDIFVVILHVDSWIPDYADSEAMEAFRNFPALIQCSFRRVFILGRAQIQVHIDYRHFFKVVISTLFCL